MFGKMFAQNKKIKKDVTKRLKVEKDKKNEIRERIEENLKGSKFRLINEFLYTRNSKDSLVHFKQNQSDFDIYHQGFKQQTKSWSVQPVQLIAKVIMQDKVYNDNIILDLGCGKGELYKILLNNGNISKKVQQQQQQNSKPMIKQMFNYDLVASDEFIEVQDIMNLPQKNNSVDCCVFCLALMGTNYIEFIIEAIRVLKINGRLIISEVLSRLVNIEMFIQMLEYLGLSLLKQEKPSEYFILLQFVKVKDKKNDKQKKFEMNSNINRVAQQKSEKVSKKMKMGLNNLDELSRYLLKPCIYKKR